MYLSFFAAERAQYADIRCSANLTLVLSDIKKKTILKHLKMQIEITIPKKKITKIIDVSPMQKFLNQRSICDFFFLLACPNYCHMPCSNAKILTVSALDGIL